VLLLVSEEGLELKQHLKCEQAFGWQPLLKAKLTLQVPEQTISEPFAGFGVFAPDH